MSDNELAELRRRWPRLSAEQRQRIVEVVLHDLAVNAARRAADSAAGGCRHLVAGDVLALPRDTGGAGCGLVALRSVLCGGAVCDA